MPSVTVAHFHQLWAELHRRALTAGLASSAAELAWIDRFTNRIRCAGCRKHWREIIAKHPPPFSDTRARSRVLFGPTSRSSYFAWTVRAHNEINRLLGKPIVSLRRARRIWAV